MTNYFTLISEQNSLNRSGMNFPNVAFSELIDVATTALPGRRNKILSFFFFFFFFFFFIFHAVIFTQTDHKCFIIN